MPQRASPPDDLARWTAVDRYYGERLGDSDPALEATLRRSEAAGLPAIQVAPLQGKFLHLLARAIGARRILELGTLGGYSTTWLARALPEDGRLLSLEIDPRHAEVARRNLDAAGVGDRVEIRVGPAREGLARLREERAAPFDLVFVDADKPGYPDYLLGVVPLGRPGTVLVVDNVVRRGDVADATSEDPNVRGVRAMTDRLAEGTALAATVVQTVGAKGYDGFLLAVLGPPAGAGPGGPAGARGADRGASSAEPL